MKKSNKIIGLSVLIVLVIMVGLVATSSNSSTKAPEGEPIDIENVTDIDKLKSSEYTNEAFDTLNIGDAKADVEAAMGSLTKEDIESEYDVFSVEDNGTTYFFYFEDDTLANVSVFV